MKLFKRSVSTLIGATAIGLCIITAISVFTFFRVAHSSEENQFFLISSILHSRFTSTETRAQQVGEMVAQMPRVRQYFGDRNRSGLYKELKELFEVQQEKYGIENIHFVEPPSTSFLRMRSPEKFGDDLSYKPQVLESAREGVSKKGETINRTGPVIYAVVPVRDTLDSLRGCVEVGIDIGRILDKLVPDFNIESALIVSEKQLKEVATDVGADVMNESNRIGSYYKFHASNWELLKNLVSADDVASSEEAQSRSYVREYTDISYGVVLFPITNYQGELVGYVAAASDFSASRSAANRTILLMVTGSVVCFLFLAGLVIMVVKGGVVRPLQLLGEHYGALAAGDTQQELPETDRYFEEIQALAAHYETLRNAANQNEGKSDDE